MPAVQRHFLEYQLHLMPLLRAAQQEAERARFVVEKVSLVLETSTAWVAILQWYGTSLQVKISLTVLTHLVCTHTHTTHPFYTTTHTHTHIPHNAHRQSKSNKLPLSPPLVTHRQHSCCLMPFRKQGTASLSWDVWRLLRI